MRWWLELGGIRGESNAEARFFALGMLVRRTVVSIAVAVVSISPGISEASSVSLVWETGGETLDLATLGSATVFLDIRVTVPVADNVYLASVSLSYDPSKLAATSVEVCPYALGNVLPGVCGTLENLTPFGTATLVPGTVAHVAAIGVVASPITGPSEFTLGRVQFEILDFAPDSSVDGFYDLIYDGIETLPPSGTQYPAITGGAIVGAGVAATTVDTTTDGVDASPGDGACATASAECTLRAAVMEANARPGAAIIDIPAGTYLLALSGDGEDAAATGDLDITEELVLQGAGADCTTGTVITETTSTVEGAISVLGDAIEISDLCVTDSHIGITAAGGRLDLHDFALDGNTYGFRTSTGGNAIVRSGSIAGNGGGSLGGGVYNEGILHLDQVAIDDNASTSTNGIGDGHGGIANADGTLVVTNSSISGNTASFASAIHNLAELALSNVSIFGNTALDNPLFWGTFYNSGAAGVTADLTNVTIGGNSFGAVSILGGGGIRARNTIVSETAGCAVPMVSLGYNRDSGTSCGFTATGDQQNVAIAFTQDTSGPTTTLVPTSGTNVQDLGSDKLCPHVDQRLHHRPDFGGCDIGAAELASAPACGNGLDDDGDGFCDTTTGSCTDGSTPGDPGCADASDPQELELSVGDVLAGDGGLMRLDPTTGDVRVLSRGLGPEDVWSVAQGVSGIFLTDNFKGRVYEIDRHTGLSSLLAADGWLAGPRGISIDSAGRLLVAERTGQRIVRIDAETGAQTSVSFGFFGRPDYVMEDPSDGSLLVSDVIVQIPQGVYRIDAITGSVLEGCSGSPFDNPRQLVLSDNAETLWLVDSDPGRLYEIDLTVSLNSCSPTQIGVAMGEAWGLALDSDGDLIVASRTEGLFQYVDPDTGVQTVINESPNLSLPHEITYVPAPGQLPVIAAGIAVLLALARRRAARSR